VSSGFTVELFSRDLIIVPKSGMVLLSRCLQYSRDTRPAGGLNRARV
jgi:hypothetical protein